MSTHCRAKELLTDKEIHFTSTRESILKEILHIDGTFSANDLLVKCNNKIDRATVFRSINLFLKKKIIREIKTTEGARIFEKACIHNPPHAHFFCEKCKNHYCLSSLPSIAKSLDNNYISVINEITLNISGICKSCTQKSPR